MQIFERIGDPALIAMLRQGDIGVIPTDTVYGLVGAAGNEAVIERMFTVKKRDSKPGTIIAADVEQLAALGIKSRYLKAVAGYWPNPISVLIPYTPDYLSRGLPGLAVRIPKDVALATLLRETGPLMTTSANAPGAPTATNIKAARDYFGDDVDFYVDIGELGERPPSTIIRIIDDAIEVVRPGAVTIDENGRIST